MQVKGRKLAAINHTGGTFMPVARRQFTTLRSAFVTCINFIGRRTSSANRRRESGPVITREDVSGSKAAPSAQFFSELNIVPLRLSRRAWNSALVNSRKLVPFLPKAKQLYFDNSCA